MRKYIILLTIIGSLGLPQVSFAQEDEAAALKRQIQELQKRVEELEKQSTGSLPLPAPSQRHRAMGFSAFDHFGDPLAQMERMQQEMNRMFEEAFDQGGPGAGMGQGFDFQPSSDIKESDDSYVITMDLPGMDKDKINVETKDHMLIVSGEREAEHSQESDQFYKRERSFGSFYRSLPIPDDAKDGELHAKYENGVLKVTIPKDKAKQVHDKPTERHNVY